jgi:hypothetical protein
MAKPKKTSNTKAVPLIQGREPFQGSNMAGHEGGPASMGWLRGTHFHDQIDRLKNPDYTVTSYGTPIAVHHEGGWEYPDVSHSPTTGKHQSIVRRAIGVKSAREKKMDERAAKKKAKSDTQEQELWNK